MVRTVMLLGLLALVACIAGPTRAADDGKLGEWHLDPERSVLAGPPPAQDIRLYERTGPDMVRSTHRVTARDGSVFTTVYVARNDGRDYPMQDGNGVQTGTIALHEEGPRTQTFVTRRNGATTGRGRTTVSADGQTLTMEIEVMSGAGAARTIRTVFRRAH